MTQTAGLGAGASAVIPAIARLRYTTSRHEWQIYWRDRNLKFHAYDRVPPTTNVEALMAEIDADPTAIFWG